MTISTLLRNLACSTAVAAGLLSAAAGLPGGAAFATETRDLNMGAGKSVIVDLPEDAAEIYVGDPKVANAIVKSARRLYVTAVANGATTIFALGPNGGKIAIIQVSVGRDIGSLKGLLDVAIPGNQIQVRTASDSIILTGSVDSAGDAAKAIDIAKGYAQEAAAAAPNTAAAPAASGGAAAPAAAPATALPSNVINSITIKGLNQVALKVTVAEIRRDIVKQLGVNWSAAFDAHNSVNISNPFTINGSLSATAANFGWASGAQSILATLNAYERQGVAHTLAEPTITAVSGETAKFLAGGTIPITAGETCSQGTGCIINVVQQPYGVNLGFTPVVLSEGRIQMRIMTEVTDIDYSVQLNNLNVSIPGFRTRRNETTVELPSGGSLATAGLILSQTDQGYAKVPGLGDLPVIGPLFRSRDFKKNETELLIVVTPYIVHAIDAKDVVRPDQNFVEASDQQAWLLGRVNRIYSTAHGNGPAPTYTGELGFIAK